MKVQTGVLRSLKEYGGSNWSAEKSRLFTMYRGVSFDVSYEVKALTSFKYRDVFNVFQSLSSLIYSITCNPFKMTEL